MLLMKVLVEKQEEMKSWRMIAKDPVGPWGAQVEGELRHRFFMHQSTIEHKSETVLICPHTVRRFPSHSIRHIEQEIFIAI